MQSLDALHLAEVSKFRGFQNSALSGFFPKPAGTTVLHVRDLDPSSRVKHPEIIDDPQDRRHIMGHAVIMLKKEERWGQSLFWALLNSFHWKSRSKSSFSITFTPLFYLFLLRFTPSLHHHTHYQYECTPRYFKAVMGIDKNLPISIEG